MKKKTKAIIIITVILIWNHLPYYYNNEKAASYATSHSAPTSRTMCAWYVIKAMWHGGCPIGLVPAYAYDKILPKWDSRKCLQKDMFPKKATSRFFLRTREAVSAILPFIMANSGCRITNNHEYTPMPLIRKMAMREYSMPATVGIGSMCGLHP